MSVRPVLWCSVTFALGIIVACSDSPPSAPSPADYSGSCNILASRCHPIATPLGKECHELGHEGDDSKCGPRKNECLAECPESDGGHASQTDSGRSDPTDAATDAGPCATYCACMAATCADESGYPFADEAACLSACAGFSVEDRACYADHCEDAKVAADKAHDCEHASGAIACD